MKDPCDKPSAKRNVWVFIVPYVFVVFSLVGARGILMGKVLAGDYLLQSWLVDSLGFLLLLVFFRGVDFGVQWLLGRWMPGNGWKRTALGLGVRVGVVVFFFLPPLMVLLQLHPQKVSSSGDPASLGMDFEEVRLESGGVGLAGWYIPGSQPEGPVVLVAHGIGANRQNFLPPVRMLHGLGFTSRW